MNEQPRWADEATLGSVRPAVRAILLRSTAFAALPKDEQQALARDLVQVGSYLANPEGLVTRGRQTLAEAQADNVQQAGAAATRTESAGEDFRGGAIAAGTDQFTRLVQAVDFSKFVGGLIENVFSAIVDSSIKQMRAYGDLVSNVAKTVDQFAADNITDNNARDWLVSAFPGDLAVDTGGSSAAMDATSPAAADGEPAVQPKLVTTAEDPAATLTRILQNIGGTKPVSDLDSPESEAELVRQAKLHIARGRQQLLASMVLLGINRIVITDGHINAKVVFDMRASDDLRREAKASLYDQNAIRSKTTTHANYNSWLSPVDAGMTAELSTDHVTTVQSSVDDTSESKAAVKAQLTGEVRVNFKSDYLPMDKMATPQMIAAIQGNAQPVAPPADATKPAQPG